MDFQESVNSSTEINGSGQLKQERSGLCDESLRPSKLHKPADDFSMFMRSGHSTMLSFSSPKSQEIPFLCTSTTANSNNISAQDSSRTLSFPLFDSGSLFTRASAYGSGGPNESPCVPFARFRGPFTPSQWMELEHQALIYKHFVANVPVPHQLLIPLKRSLNPYAFSGLSPGPYASNWGWGTFHLGFAGNTDPEPGRCRRTDGKKWRCSREAVPDQKYCERHINRGRHRSRKPVEGQNGHVVSGSTSTKVASVAPLQPTAANPSTHLLVNRMQDHKGVSSVIAPTIGLKLKDSAISVQKQHSGFELSSQSDFGLVSTDSLLNPSQRNEQHPVHHFIDGWKSDELKSDWTQLSISIPMGASDFSSSSNSPRQEKLAVSPLRLSRDFDPIQMGLGVTNSHEEESMQKTGNWVPVSWGNSLGGPLGEVLNSTAGNAGWDDSHHFGSSPTGVLQKSTFVSLSNSSSGSSPRADSKKIHEGAGMCDEVIGSAVANSLCIPSM